jgi:hypothetical protein
MMGMDEEAADIAARAEGVFLAACDAGGHRPAVLWVASLMLLAATAARLGKTPSERDQLLMQAEDTARRFLVALDAAERRA